MGVIRLNVCADGNVAKWRARGFLDTNNDGLRDVITFRIVDTVGVGPEVIESIRMGIRAWNVSQVYALEEVSMGEDITVMLVDTVVAHDDGVVGLATTACGVNGIERAVVRVDVARENLQYLQNVTMHEVGHALGLGHSNIRGDIMSPIMSKIGAKERVVFPEQRHFDALRAERAPFIPA